MWKSGRAKIFAVIFAAGALLTSTEGRTQSQFHLGQYMVHQPFINPAAMSSSQYVNAALFYRNQWVGFDGAPVVQGVNFVFPFGKTKNQFAGITIIRDEIGISKSHQISAAYAYRIRTGNLSRLSFGLTGTVNLLQSNYGLLHVHDASDPLFQNNTPTFVMPNFKFGMYFQRKGFYAGLSLPNILENSIIYSNGLVPATEFDVSAIHFYFHTGYSFSLKNNHKLNVSTMVKEVGGAPVQGDVNAQILFNNRFGLGASCRTSGEVLGIVSFKFMQFFQLSYAFEYNYAKLGSYSNGTHEALLIYQFIPPKTAIIEVPRF